MASYKQTIAFLGATGGTGGACLASALRAGHHCVALARTPDKLRDMLSTTHGIVPEIMEKYLKVYKGDAKRIPDVAKALVSPVNNKHLVDVIHSSIGGYPKFRFSLMEPLTLTEPTICEDGMAVLFLAIDQLASQGVETTHAGQKPLLIAVSSTASETLRHSLPWLMIPLYYWLLRGPHADKQNMERLVKADNGTHVQNFIIIRPAILTNAAEVGEEKVRVGWVWGIGGIIGREKEPGPAIGWTIGRKDLGGWIFKNAIIAGGWEGRCVSLCY